MSSYKSSIEALKQLLHLGTPDDAPPVEYQNVFDLLETPIFQENLKVSM